MILPDHYIPKGSSYRHVRFQFDLDNVTPDATTGEFFATIEVDFTSIAKYMPKTNLGSIWIENVTGQMFVNERVAGTGFSVPENYLMLNFFPGSSSPSPANFPYPEFNVVGASFESQIAGTHRGRRIIDYIDLIDRVTNFALVANINDVWADGIVVGDVDIHGDINFDHWVVPPPDRA